MDVNLRIDSERGVVLDKYAGMAVMPVPLSGIVHDDLVSVIHYALRRVVDAAHEKYPGSVVTSTLVLANVTSIELLSKSELWIARQATDNVVGDLFKIGNIVKMDTLPDTMIRLFVQMRDGMRAFAMYGLIDTV